ncbi:MAG TPA: hypothetical protein EYP60_09885 [bacterium (Candidatus Stahlbacteria)]|nr:hypothetical protein [Candidatus Stahlbacteria bacterium]
MILFEQAIYDKCWNNNGNPCHPSSGGVGDAPYDHEYGCYECSVGFTVPVLSRDSFAVRPDKLDTNINHPDYPHLLRAGEDYSVSLTARDAESTTVTSNYTITDHNWVEDLNTSTIKYFKDDTEDTAGLLQGDADVNTSITAYSVAGLSSITTSGPATSGTADHIIPVSYSDVGKITLTIYDQNWSAVDIGDTPEDCDDSHAHTYICGELNVTFIPHHFSFAELNITNHAGPDSNFTYVADNRGMPSTGTLPTRSPMAARVQTRIEALSKNDTITENFRTGNLYYENPISVTPIVKVPASGNTDGYLYPDANESNITTQLIGFGRTGLDDNGTRNIVWDENTYPLDFNFQREINEPANPFDVNGSRLSISLLSKYTDTTGLTTPPTADINGSRAGANSDAWAACASDDGCVQLDADNNVTFYYGRAQSSLFYYENIKESSIITPIAATVYCDPTIVNCTDFGIDTGKTGNEENWYIVTGHNANRGDGNITIAAGTPLIEGSGSPTINGQANPNTTNVMIVSNGEDRTVSVSSGNSPTLPMTVPLELIQDGDTAAPPYTNEWLIYNKDFPAPPTPFYKVQFLGGESEWTGVGETGYIVDINASRKKLKRLDW